MPKRTGNLWQEILAWDNLLLAAKEASRNKRFHMETLRFNARLEENLLELRYRLASGQWHPDPYRTFEIYDPKKRTIHAPSFRDRVVHHALVQVIGSLFECRFIEQSFACRKGKGTHAASSYLSHILRSASAKWDNVYVLKADVTRYFPSINHEILIQIISRVIKDNNVMELIKRLVNDSIADTHGLPLGALTSQLFANAYLNRLDHYVKEELHIKYYVRYMDDFIILHHDKQELWKILAHIRDFLAYELRLTLNQKTQIFPSAHGVDFAGYRHWASHTLPRKRNVRRAKHRFAGLSRCYARGEVEMDTVRCCVASFVGYMQHCKGWISGESTLARLVLRRSHFESEE